MSPRPTVAIGRVFIDCTATWEHDANTGIQRVVRNVVNTAGTIGPDLGLSCQPVVFDVRSGFLPIDELPSPSRDRSLAGGATFRERLRSKAKEWLIATNLIEPARELASRVRRARYKAYFPARRKSGRAVRCGPGDVLLLVDSSWDPNYPWDDVCEAQARGALVGLVVYDLIPVQFPEVVGRRTHELYSRWWDKARNIADFVIGISNSVLDDIAQVDRARRPAGAPLATAQSAFFRLGAELDGNVGGRAHEKGGTGSERHCECPDEIDVSRGACPPFFIRDELAAAFGRSTNRKTYLMVGMISPRKNHALALDAFDRLWEGGADMSLAIAGRYGWDCATLSDRIRRHPQLGRKLYWFEDVGDHELDYCYRHAAGLITTSFAEGFNLPIVESLSKGCPVLASDLPVHREVAGEYAAYFPPRDAPALASLVARHQRHGALPGVRSPENFHWPDWTESCRDLLKRVIELASTRTRGPVSAHRRVRPAA